MRRDPSSLGMILASLRYDRRMTQDDVVASMNSAGYYMTRQILVNIETGRGAVKHPYIEAFLDVYKIDANRLFPPERRKNRPRILGLTKEVPTRKRRRRRKPSRPHQRRTK